MYIERGAHRYVVARGRFLLHVSLSQRRQQFASGAPPPPPPPSSSAAVAEEQEPWMGHLALGVEGLHHHTAICALDAQPPPARSRKALAKLAEHAAKKSKQMHGEPSSTSPSDDAVRMDVERARCVALRHPIAPPHPESLTHAEVRPACRQPERRAATKCSVPIARCGTRTSPANLCRGSARRSSGRLAKQWRAELVRTAMGVQGTPDLRRQ